MVNPVVDCYTKTLNHRNIVRKYKKIQLTENQKITKTKIWVKWASVFHI